MRPLLVQSSVISIALERRLTAISVAKFIDLHFNLNLLVLLCPAVFTTLCLPCFNYSLFTVFLSVSLLQSRVVYFSGQMWHNNEPVLALNFNGTTV